MKDGLMFFKDIEYTIAAFIIFLILFCGIVMWVYRKSAKGFYQSMESMPLHEGQENQP